MRDMRKNKQFFFVIGIVLFFFLCWISIYLISHFIIKHSIDTLYATLFFLSFISSLIGLSSFLITIIKKNVICYFITLLTVVSITFYILFLMIKRNYPFYNYFWFVFSISCIMILLLNNIKLDLTVDTVKNKTSKSFTYK
jgi:hypothetical protein